MYLTYTRHRVKDYNQWLKAFEANTHILIENGITEWKIVQINGDQTDVAVIVMCPSKKEWDNFIAADAKKREETGTDPRKTGTLIGDPEWWAGKVVN